MVKVKTLTPRGSHKTMEVALKEINQWYGRWANYYSLTPYPAQLKKNQSPYGKLNNVYIL
jgi:RNA-directed DNA polymerase